MLHLDSILDFENNSEILSYRFSFDNMLIWPFCRFMILENTLSLYNNWGKAHVSRGKIDLAVAFKYLVQTVTRKPYPKSSYPITIFTTGRVNTAKIDGKYFNILHDYFGEVFSDKTLLIEDSYRMRYFTPKYFKNTVFHDYIKVKAHLLSRIDKASSRDILTIESFITFLKETYPFELSEPFLERISGYLKSLSVRLKHFKKSYELFFTRVRPKVLFLNAACYGFESYLVKWAKEHGIVTAELQHGIINKEHPAYNYGKTMQLSKEFVSYLPDYFLTWGEFWNNGISVPVEKRIVGNPHFLTSIEKIATKKDLKKKNKTILIISDGNLPDLFNTITSELSKALKDDPYELILRLHPGETPEIDKRYGSLSSRKNVSINASGDIYGFLEKADFIIGCASTAVIESLAFGKPLFIIDNNLSRLYIPDTIGIWFKQAGEIVDRIKSNDPCLDAQSYDPQYYWNRDWKKEYIDFIESFL